MDDVLQIIDMPMSRKQRQPINHGDAEVQFQDKSVLICPDTNVLSHMLAPEKITSSANSPFLHFEKLDLWMSSVEKWLSQIEACESLLNMNEVGWLVPQQVRQEIRDRQAKFNILKRYKDNLKGAEKLLSSELQKMVIVMAKKIDELTEKAPKIYAQIASNLTVLEEEAKHAVEAWQLVREDDFPNAKKNQQMKDSVILCHLLDFGAKVEKPLFFWTFDKFDRHLDQKPVSLFPVDKCEYNINVFHDISDALPSIEKEVRDSKKSLETSGVQA